MKPLLLGERSNPLKSWMGDAKRREEAVISVHKALQHSVGNRASSFIHVVVFLSSLYHLQVLELSAATLELLLPALLQSGQSGFRDLKAVD